MWRRNRVQTFEKTAKLDTWVYSFRTLDVSDGRTDGAHDMFQTVERKVQIDFVCEKKFLRTTEAPYPLHSIKFLVVCKELDLKFEGTDGEVLRQVIFGAIDERVKVKWEPWLRVSVHHERMYSAEGSEGYSLGYEEFERGTLPDGRYVRKENNTLYAWAGDDSDGKAAIIPDTPENRRKMQDQFDRLQDLQIKMREDFSPANIAQTLNLSGFPVVYARARSRRK